MGKTKNIEFWARLFFSVALSTSFIMGKKVGSYPQLFEFEIIDVVKIIWLAILIWVVAFFLVQGIKNWAPSSSRIKWSKRKTFLALMGCILISWLPYYFSFYPILISPDSIDMLYQIEGVYALNDHHPMVFTLFLKLFVMFGKLLGSINVGLAIFAAFQMIVTAASLSVAFTWIALRTNIKMVLPALVFVCIVPLYGAAMMCAWKDILFSLGVFVFTLFVVWIVKSQGEALAQKKTLVLLAFLGVWVILFRHNGVFAFVGTIAVLFFVYRKKITKKLLVTAICTILVCTVGVNTVRDARGIEKGDFVESVGIPLQQMAATVAWDGNITESQAEFLNQLMPLDLMKEKFSTYFVDPIKFNEEFSKPYLSEHKAEFFKTWLQMLPNNFESYVKAYMMITDGYWNVRMANDAGLASLLANQDPATMETLGITVPSQNHTFLGLDMKELFLTDSGALIILAPNMAIMLFAVLFAGVVLVSKRQYHMCLALLPLGINWGTIMIAAPTCNDWRYLFSAYLIAPVLLTFAIAIKNKAKSVEE